MTEGQVVTLVLGPGGALVIVLVFLWAWFTGKVHSPSEFKREVERGEQWHALFESERTSHQVTREALAAANERADAAVEAAKVTKQLLEVTQERQARAASRARKP